MTEHHRELVLRDVKRGVVDNHLRIARRFLSVLRCRLCSCSPKPRSTYRRISASPSLPNTTTTTTTPPPAETPTPPCPDAPADSDLVPLKVSLLGDPQIGKTSFMVKYVGDAGEPRGLSMSGLNLMDKMLRVKGARIVFTIWDVAGAPEFVDHVPIACRDSAAILIMFDLTSRCTLNNVMCWYKRARRWNKTAIAILIGTKFDDFVQLPLDIQWAVANQARACARAMNATLFFSSATHDINVSKIFKFITAKFFDLSWTVERNLTLGEPIIDF